jgi:hypothetical protein
MGAMMPARNSIPGLKKIPNAQGQVTWYWAASQVSRLATGFRPRTVRLWEGDGSPSAQQREEIESRATRLWLDLQEWLYSRPRRTRSKRGLIYFVRVGDKVKIGFTNDVHRRLSELQVSSPVKLEPLLILRGSAVMERALHRKFKAQRLNREWFRLDGPLAAFIRREQIRPTGQKQASESLSESLLKNAGGSI